MGSPVQGCGGGGPSEPAAASAADSPDKTHRIEFHFKTDTDNPQPVSDSEGFKLTHPSGREEHGQLQSGALERNGVPEGLYRMEFKTIDACEWDQSSYWGEPMVGMGVSTSGFPDGTSVKFRVFRQFQSLQTDPVFETSGSVSNGTAAAAWQYKQKLGEPPGGDFVFQVQINEKRAISDAMTIYRYALDLLLGVQQRLKELGYDSGPTDGIMGPKTKAAVEAFQGDHPPLDVDGIPGPYTQAELELG